MMRLPLIGSLLLAAVATPALAQREESVDRRVDRIEKELRAVQRRVFPGGAGIEPEIVQAQPGTGITGVPASNAVADLNARVDALETQLRTLTGQAEENGFRLRQLEATLNQLRADTDARLKQVEQRLPTPPAPTDDPEPASDGPAPASGAGPATGDPGEDAYLAGYRLWNAGDFTEAQKTLDAMIKKYPRHNRTSYARNLLGRAYLDGGKPATAAKIFLGNYQEEPKGERAADSLYFLGQALVKLNKPAEACKVYDELQDVYGTTMRDWIKQRLPQGRREAKCG